MRVCAADGCPAQVERGYCERHRPERRRSPSSRITGTERWRRLKRKLLARPENRWCFYCDVARATTLDHRVPVSKGGDPWDEANLVPSCQPCNAKKGGRDG